MAITAKALTYCVRTVEERLEFKLDETACFSKTSSVYRGQPNSVYNLSRLGIWAKDERQCEGSPCGCCKL